MAVFSPRISAEPLSTSGDTTSEVYLDNAATAPLHPHAAQAVLAGQRLIGNPSSRHGVGKQAAHALADARATVARLFDVAPDDVVFTSGGSEGNSLALWGTFAARGFRGHLVTTSIEHPAVLANARALQELGVDVTMVGPAPSGHVEVASIEAAMRADTVLVSIMHANNETGAIQPVCHVTEIAAGVGAAVHVDAVHTAGKLDLTGVAATLISVSAHKFGGPRGAGALVVRDGHRLMPVVCGGPQEHRLRAGTENVPGAMGMAAAVEVCLDRMSASYRSGVRDRREQLVQGLLLVGGVHLNVNHCVLEETVSIRFDGIRADTLADELDMHGIYVSTGSACHAGSDSVSHVLEAMGMTAEQARATVRFSFGPDMSASDIERVVAVTTRAVCRLRGIAGGTGAKR